jgi:hypothetical protein
MTTPTKTDPRFLPNVQAFALCGICGTHYEIGTSECSKCHSPLALMRKCPQCDKLLSFKHERCIYCATSFVYEEGHQPIAPMVHPAAAVPEFDPNKKRRAILISVGVFLAVTFLGLYASLFRHDRAGAEVAATTYLLRQAPLRLQPSSTSGSSSTLGAATVVAINGLATDSEGHRWYVTRQDNRDKFLAVTEVAPPKARLPELGSQMLRAWLVAFRDPSLVPEADSAVNYYCANFGNSPHCEELRWLAAERFRSFAQRGNEPDTLNRARHLYQTLADGKGSTAGDAAKALNELSSGGTEKNSPAGRSRKASGTKTNGYGDGREYALVDRAEVRVKVPDLKAVEKGAVIRTPIAKEIQINGKVAIPSNAICILKISGSDRVQDQLTVQLTGIDVGNKHYTVATAPQRVPASGAMVVFPLESSLLIGK